MQRLFVPLFFLVSILMFQNLFSATLIASTCHHPIQTVSADSSIDLNCLNIQDCCSQNCHTNPQASLYYSFIGIIKVPTFINFNDTSTLITAFIAVAQRPPKAYSFFT